MPQPTPRRVSIFVPTFNRQQMLDRALASIAAQTYADFSVLVLDNGSTPPAVLPAQCLNDPRFSIKRIKDNAHRWAFEREQATALTSTYHALLYDDDAWAPNKLEKQIAVLDGDPGIAACFTHVDIIRDDGTPFIDPPSPYPDIFRQPNRSRTEWGRRFFTLGNCLCMPSALLRTAQLPHIILPRPYLQLGDFMMWVKLLGQGDIHVIQEPLTHYRVSETGDNESYMSESSSNRFQYELTRALHLFLHLPHELQQRIFSHEAASEAELEIAIAEMAKQAGSRSHLRFVAEYAETLIEKYLVADAPGQVAYWFTEYSQASGGISRPAPPTPADSRALLKSGISDYQAGNLPEAIEAISASLAQEDDPLAYTYLALICAARGLHEDAATFIERAESMAPHRADLVAALGEAFLKAGNPEEATRYLQLAIEKRPDFFAAYPALARSLYLMGQGENAVLFLKVAAAIPSEAQANIQTTLLEILAEQGDIAVFAETCLRYSRGIADDLLAARTFARFELSGELLVGALAAAQARLAELPLTESAPSATSTNAPLRIAFMVSDFAHEQRHGRLFTLLRHLSPEHFITALLFNTPCATLDDYAQSCLLITDYNLGIHADDDATALDKITSLAPDVLIDLDSYGPADRLTVFAQASVPFKLTWGEAPMPPLVPNCRPLVGEFIADDAMLPGITLPGLGECLTLPELSIAPSEAFVPGGTRFGCLTPAIRIGPESWQLFAEILLACPQSTLTLNLKDLGDGARASITHRFTAAGVDAARLCFVEAHTVEELCRRWTSLDLGLAPLVDSGDLALPACLWMGRPFVAMAASLPWSHRPAALLECAGAAAWIADTPERYLELAAQRPPAPDNALREHLRTFTDPAAFVQGFAASITAMVRNSATSPLSA